MMEPRKSKQSQPFIRGGEGGREGEGGRGKKGRGTGGKGERERGREGGERIMMSSSKI